jgi:LmbE family N-acetylglucosaminyl deacetylase
MLDQKCLLAVFAHPDDEALTVGGVIRASSDLGIKTALICATRGEAGQISDPALATPETLGAVRESELREACRILGVSDLSFLEYHDGTLAQAPEDEAVERIVRTLRRLRPQVVITFDANGGYGHTDHMAIHHFTRMAFQRAGDHSCYPAHLSEGLAAHAPQKLYYAGFARGTMAGIRQAMQEAGGDFRPGGDQATIPLEEMGTADDRITTTIPLDDRLLAIKKEVWSAHRTQNPPGSFLSQLPDAIMQPWLGTERLVLAWPAGAPGDGSEHDIFAGVV